MFSRFNMSIAGSLSGILNGINNSFLSKNHGKGKKKN